MQEDTCSYNIIEIPTESVQDPFYSESNMAALRESIAQIDRGDVVVKSIEDLESVE